MTKKEAVKAEYGYISFDPAVGIDYPVISWWAKDEEGKPYLLRIEETSRQDNDKEDN